MGGSELRESRLGRRDRHACWARPAMATTRMSDATGGAEGDPIEGAQGGGGSECELLCIRVGLDAALGGGQRRDGWRLVVPCVP